MNDSRVVVIGGGVIGLSVAYHLGRTGESDVLVLERNRVAGGTSWHAAGIVGPLRASRNLTELARYGVELFHRLEDETGQATGYRQTGGYWLAQSNDRLEELKRLAAMGRTHDLDTRMMTPSEVVEDTSFLSPEGLCGALWVREDGQINPVDLCVAYMRGARNHDVEIREHSGVKRMIRVGDRISSVVLDDGEVISTRAVINCAGLWAREVGDMVHADVPLRAVEHMYIVSEPVPGLQSPCPIVRDLDSGIYFKGDSGRLVLGTFEANARIWEPASVPPGHDFLEFPEDWDHAEPMLEAGIRRAPVLAELGIARFMNGPESFTPDTRQNMGRMPGFSNFYVAAGFNSIGIMSSAGVGRSMAEWVTQGRPARELWSVDIQRHLPGDNELEFLDGRIPESVHNQFSIHWPYLQNATGRDRTRSAWHRRFSDNGAVFGAPTGWERPLWFAENEAEKEFRHSYGVQCWWPAARREARKLMSSGAVFELSPFSKFLVKGAESANCLQRICTNDLDVPPGRIVYSLWLNDRGGIEGECTVTRLEAENWLVVTGAATRVRDYWYLREHMSESVTVADVTENHAVLGIMGPDSGDLLQVLSETDMSPSRFPYSTSRHLMIDGKRVRAGRTSYVGERGWELLIPVEDADRVLARVEEEMARRNMGFAGHFCLDACRLEKGFVHWGHDIGPDDDPVSAGLMFAVRLKGQFDFIGKKSLLAGIDRKPVMKRCLFEVLAPEPPLLLHDEPIWCGEQRAGHSTSGGIGFRTDKVLSMGFLRSEYLSGNDSDWSIEVGDDRFPLKILERPPYDPDGLRMRT